VRTFTYSDGKSLKFWSIDLDGTQLRVTYGLAGTEGQTQTETFLFAPEAEAAEEQLIREKLAKGYVETQFAYPAETTEGMLERQVFADPDDVATLGVYADRLCELGDPRGEFIHIQLALEQEGRSSEMRRQLQERGMELFAKHGRTWLGELADYLLDQRGVPEYLLQGQGGYRFQFARGWLHSLRIPVLSSALARYLAGSSAMRLLQRLEIYGLAYEESADDSGDDLPANTSQPALYPLLRSPFLGNLRVFHLGEPADDVYPNCHTVGHAAAALVEKLPRLEELYLFAHDVDTDRLFAQPTLDNLRILQVYHLHRYPLHLLANNESLGRLTHLLLQPHALEPRDERPYITLEGLRAVVRSPCLRNLTHLRLRLSDLGNEGCEEIVQSGALRRLKVLDLMHGRITDRGAAVLAACPDLRHLDLLEVSFNQLTPTGIAALRATKVPLQAARQRQPGDDEEYLYAGDME
jgi:uncharacterized protein (TIGR02996 family)